MRFTDFGKLRLMIESIGVDYVGKTKERQKVLWEGELIDGKKDLLVLSEGLFEILPDGNVIRVIVHAPQGPYQNRNISEKVLMIDPVKGWHKFHVLWCNTVGKWKHRLRKTNRNDGAFTYPLFWRDGTEFKPELRDGGRRLHLCRNCANLLKSKGVSVEVENFDVQGFLCNEQLGGSFPNMNYSSDFDLIPNVYADDWDRISHRFKSMRRWTCEQCYINLSDHRKFLHAHHRDHHKANNGMFNLQALCIRCHANEHPNDARLNDSQELREFTKRFPR
tara:strand:- start:996 stop:1826 length:831 start_codon:yes stop_codon:yes gene_type:complete